MMAPALFDAALSSSARNERTAAIAEAFIQSALADLQRIKQLHKSLLPTTREQLDVPTLTLVRGMYEEWAGNAEGLLNRVEQLQKRIGKIAGSEALGDAYGKTRAMLSVTIEAMIEGRRDIAEGRVFSGEEVRRELRLKRQSAGKK